MFWFNQSHWINGFQGHHWWKRNHCHWWTEQWNVDFLHKLFWTANKEKIKNLFSDVEKKLILNERSYNPSQVCKSMWKVILTSSKVSLISMWWWKVKSDLELFKSFLSSALQRPASSSSPACPRHAQDTRCLVRLIIIITGVNNIIINIIFTTITIINIITTTTSGSTWWEILPTISLPMFSSQRCANNTLNILV